MIQTQTSWGCCDTKGKIESVVLLGKDVSNICIAPSLRKLIDSCDEKINAKDWCLCPPLLTGMHIFDIRGKVKKKIWKLVLLQLAQVVLYGGSYAKYKSCSF